MHPGERRPHPPRLGGLQIGVVTDNEDPDGEFRVRLRLPLIDPAALVRQARSRMRGTMIVWNMPTVAMIAPMIFAFWPCTKPKRCIMMRKPKVRIAMPERRNRLRITIRSAFWPMRSMRPIRCSIRIGFQGRS